MSSVFPEFLYDFKIREYSKLDSGKKVVFHHLEKTAGSTFRGILASLVHESEICPAQYSKELAEYVEKNSESYRFFAGHFRYQWIRHYLKDSIFLTLLRDPIERTVSQYHNHANSDRIPIEWKQKIAEASEWHQSESNDHADKLLGKSLSDYIDRAKLMSLEEWLQSKDRAVNSYACNRQTQGFLPDLAKREVVDWAKYDPTLLQMAKENLKNKFAFVGIQEFFDLSIDLFCMTFGLNPVNASLYTTNLNTNKELRKKYDLPDKVLQLLHECNRMDIELYEYAKSVFFDRLHDIYRPLVSLNRKVVIEKKLDTGNLKADKMEIDPDHIGINECYSTYGFYAEEKSGEVLFRWTGYDSPSILEILYSFETETEYFFELQILASMGKDVEQNIAIKIDEQPVQPEIRKEPGNLSVNFKIKMTSNMTQTVFHQLKIVSPLKKEHDRDGARNLGLAIAGLKISK